MINTLLPGAAAPGESARLQTASGLHPSLLLPSLPVSLDGAAGRREAHVIAAATAAAAVPPFDVWFSSVSPTARLRRLRQPDAKFTTRLAVADAKTIGQRYFT